MKKAAAKVSSQSPPKKRSRVGLSLGEKKALCLHRRMFPKKRYHEVASWIFDNFRKVIAQNTVDDIVRREEFWLATSEDAATLHKVPYQRPNIRSLRTLFTCGSLNKGLEILICVSAMICSLKGRRGSAKNWALLVCTTATDILPLPPTIWDMIFYSSRGVYICHPSHTQYMSAVVKFVPNWQA